MSIFHVNMDCVWTVTGPRERSNVTELNTWGRSINQIPRRVVVISAQKTFESALHAGSTLASMLWERWNLYRTSASNFHFRMCDWQRDMYTYICTHTRADHSCTHIRSSRNTIRVHHQDLRYLYYTWTFSD